MVVNYGLNTPDMYQDFSIVPENVYTSPIQSPFSYQMANSPASSDISSVDSAFDELAGVIPELDVELLGEKSPKCYSDLSTMSPYASSGYYDENLSNSESEDIGRSTPSMYNSCGYADKPPENAVLEQIRKTAKRQLPDAWYNSYSDLSEIGIEGSAKKARFSDVSEMAEHAENLMAYQESKLPLGEQLKSMYAEGYNGTDISDFNNNEELSSSASSNAFSEDSDVSNSKNDTSLLFWDEEVLTKGFEILAEYISRDVNKASDQRSSEGIQQKQSREYKRDSLSDVARYQAAIQAAASARQNENGASQQMQDVPPLMFSMSNSNLHHGDARKLSLKQENRKCNSAAELVRNWKIPSSRPRKANLSLHSTTKPRLYNFLLELLRDPERYPCIEWVDEPQGIFKFLDSAQIASLWGHRKNKPHMKYENFARSLRTYIAKGILTKPRNKLVYQFTSKVV